MRSGINRIALERAFDTTAKRIDLFDRFDRVPEKLDTNGRFLLVGRKHFDHVAADAKRAAVKVDIVSLVLNIDEHAQ